jgi:hypothetical protein
MRGVLSDGGDGKCRDARAHPQIIVATALDSPQSGDEPIRNLIGAVFPLVARRSCKVKGVILIPTLNVNDILAVRFPSLHKAST